MPENNEPQYELDENYEPLGIVDAADGSGTTWPEFIGQVNKMDNQVAALTERSDSRSQGGSLSYSGLAQKAHTRLQVAFSRPMPTNQYSVAFGRNASPYASYLAVLYENKTPEGFTVYLENQAISNVSISGTVDWVAVAF